jgi:hypothetical protein
VRKGVSKLIGVYQRRGAAANENGAELPHCLGVLARKKF